jgi:hypothetical protein
MLIMKQQEPHNKFYKTNKINKTRDVKKFTSFNFDFLQKLWYNVYRYGGFMNKNIGIIVGSTRPDRMSIHIAE